MTNGAHVYRPTPRKSLINGGHPIDQQPNLLINGPHAFDQHLLQQIQYLQYFVKAGVLLINGVVLIDPGPRLLINGIVLIVPGPRPVDQWGDARLRGLCTIIA